MIGLCGGTCSNCGRSLDESAYVAKANDEHTFQQGMEPLLEPTVTGAMAIRQGRL